MITSMLAWLILVLISTKAHRSLIPAPTTDHLSLFTSPLCLNSPASS